MASCGRLLYNYCMDAIYNMRGASYSNARIIINPGVLEEDHLPDHILHAEGRIEEIEGYLCHQS